MAVSKNELASGRCVLPKMSPTLHQPDLLSALATELGARGVTAAIESVSLHASCPWSIQHDGYGFVVRFPVREMTVVDTWVKSVFGGPKFEADQPLTKIYRDDYRAITVMLAVDRDFGQFILLDLRDSRTRATLAERAITAMAETLDAAVKEAKASVQAAVDSIGSVDEEARWQEAAQAVDDSSVAVRSGISFLEELKTG